MSARDAFVCAILLLATVIDHAAGFPGRSLQQGSSGSGLYYRRNYRRQGGNPAEITLAGVPQPLLTDLELLTAQRFTRCKSNYIEWGSGGSTVLIAMMAHKAYSVENQAAWCAQMEEKPNVKFWEKLGVLKYKCVDTGPTASLGMPRAGADVQQFRAYADAIGTFGVPRFDVVFVDGRFRVACALRALWYTDSESTVMIHDWMGGREQTYGPVLEFYDIVEIADRLIVMRPKVSRNDQEHSAMLAKAQQLLEERFYADPS